MTKNKSSKEKKFVGFEMEKDHYLWLVEMSLRISLSEGKRITISEVLRRGIEAAYPMPKNPQMNLDL